jgi:hypothetical protein
MDGKARGSGGKGIGMNELKSQRTLKPKQGQAEAHGNNTHQQEGYEPIDGNGMPDLPESAWIDPDIGQDACQWLDDYINFSREWSPRAYDGFHVACGLWLLSTIAARRVCVYMGGERYTNLYFALVARTSLYAKSTTAKIAIQTIRDCGLKKLLLSDNTTPQKFILDMSIQPIRMRIDNVDVSDSPGQRGWFYEEFGQHVAAMMRSGGFMSEFLHIIKLLDDAPTDYKYGTVSRGTQTIEKPYLSLLANLTPDDLKPFASRRSRLWGDGFLARFALICPPENYPRSKELFPPYEREIPDEIIEPLKEWDKRLGSIYQPASPMYITNKVLKAYHEYDNCLMDLLASNKDHDLDGNYARFPEKALRIAALFASLSGDEHVSLKYWAKAQDLTENFRNDLHELYRQIIGSYVQKKIPIDERLLSLVEKYHGCTVNHASRFLKNVPKDILASKFEELVEEGLLYAIRTRKNTIKYVFPRETG